MIRQHVDLYTPLFSTYNRLEKDVLCLRTQNISNFSIKHIENG